MKWDWDTICVCCKDIKGGLDLSRNDLAKTMIDEVGRISVVCNEYIIDHRGRRPVFLRLLRYVSWCHVRPNWTMRCESWKRVFKYIRYVWQWRGTTSGSCLTVYIVTGYWWSVRAEEPAADVWQWRGTTSGSWYVGSAGSCRGNIINNDDESKQLHFIGSPCCHVTSHWLVS